MIFTAAQSGSIKGDREVNIRNHLKFIEIAAHYRAGFITFPELSLTGYEPEIAADISLHGSENLLQPLRIASAANNIIIAAGCPITSRDTKPYIGCLIFLPDGHLSIYHKQFLHPGEEEFFIPGSTDISVKYKSKSIAIAICADIDNPAHPAKQKNADVYAAGVMITPEGIGNTHRKLSTYAAQYNMMVIMANFASSTGKYQTAGQSAAWAPGGKIITGVKGVGESLLIVKNEGNYYSGQVINI